MEKTALEKNYLSLDNIVTAGLCMGCGLCSSLSDPGKVKVTLTPEGRLRPVEVEPLSENELEAISDVCPGIRLPSADSASLPEEVEIDTIWGPIARVIIGHATDPAIRNSGSSGGVLTALATYLLESGEVDFILHVTESKNNPILSERCLSFDAASALKAASSRYGPSSPLLDFMQVLGYERPFAVIGKPCDIAAVRNLASQDSRVNEFVRYCLSFVCGGVCDATKMYGVLKDFDIQESELSSFRYRGNGNPGPIRIETQDGRVFTLPYNKFWDAEANWDPITATWNEESLGIHPRCKLCPDAIGEVADLVAADCWPGACPVGEDDGFNAIITRTAKGEDLLKKALSQSVLTKVQSLNTRELDTFQPHQVRLKKALWARYVGMRSAGLPFPKANGLRLEELARQQGWQSLLSEARGTRDRIRAGRLGEPSAIKNGVDE